jgi:hypothetical protein
LSSICASFSRATGSRRRGAGQIGGALPGLFHRLLGVGLFEIGHESIFEGGGVLAFGEGVGRAHGQHAAAVHEGDAVAALRFVHEVGGHEDRHALLARQAQQVAPEHIARGRVHARGGLVQDEDFRAVQAGRGQLQALAHAQRQAGRMDAGHVAQLELVQRARHRLARRLAFHAVQARMQLQVLVHGQLFIEREGLRHIADLHAGRHVAGIDRLAEQLRRAAGDIQQPVGHAQAGLGHRGGVHQDLHGRLAARQHVTLEIGRDLDHEDIAAAVQGLVHLIAGDGLRRLEIRRQDGVAQAEGQIGAVAVQHGHRGIGHLGFHAAGDGINSRREGEHDEQHQGVVAGQAMEFLAAQTHHIAQPLRHLRPPACATAGAPRRYRPGRMPPGPRTWTGSRASPTPW